MPGATAAAVVNEANTIMGYVGARNATVTVVPNAFDDNTPELTVTVSVPIAGNGWVTPFFYDAADTITGQCRLRREDY